MKYSLFLILFTLLSITACRQTASETTDSPASPISGDPAIDDLSVLISQRPNDATLYAQRAEQYYEKEGYDEAIRDLQAALSLDSTNVEFHHLLADVYMDYFRSRLALRTMERAAALHPERIPTLLKLSEFQYILRQYEASMTTVDKVLKLDSRNAGAYFMLGMNFKDLGDTTRAINSFQTSVEIEPSQVDAWITLGRLHAAIRSPLAERYFDNAIAEGQGSVIPMHAKADYLRDQGDLDAALELYEEINRVDRQYEEAYFNAGMIYLKRDSLDQAYNLFNIAVGVYPLYVKAYYFRGFTAEMQGNAAQAQADYQHALNLVPDYEDAKEGLARVSGN